MIQKLKTTGIAVAMALIFTFPQLLHAMDLENESGEPSSQKTKAMTITEKNACKMWLFHEGLEQAETDNTFPPLPREVQGVIGGILYELTRPKNPVLDGSLMYKRPSDNQQFTFMIKDLVKEGRLDLSNQVFERLSNSLVITIDPKRFFLTGGENANKVIILIAPRSLIEEKIESTTQPFSMIMAGWDENVAPIGIFWRWGNSNDSQWFEYLTNKKIADINLKNLYELWLITPNNASSFFHLCSSPRHQLQLRPITFNF